TAVAWGVALAGTRLQLVPFQCRMTHAGPLAVPRVPTAQISESSEPDTARKLSLANVKVFAVLVDPSGVAGDATGADGDAIAAAGCCGRVSVQPLPKTGAASVRSSRTRRRGEEKRTILTVADRERATGVQPTWVEGQRGQCGCFGRELTADLDGDLHCEERPQFLGLREPPTSRVSLGTQNNLGASRVRVLLTRWWVARVSMARSLSRAPHRCRPCEARVAVVVGSRATTPRRIHFFSRPYGSARDPRGRR
ncbi:MAG: hypothetical protein JWM74_2663, partial [Myxococcaceae bacterium]|nr:hypothetical protein [Myxococcaceae bacterium]